MANKAIKAVVVDLAQTFVGAPLLIGVEQKMQRKDRNNPQSDMIPVAGKWTVTITARVPQTDNDGNVVTENGKVKSDRVEFNVTVAADRMPCQGVEEFTPVQIDGLTYNLMTSEQGKGMAFWRARAVRPMGQAK